GRPCVIVRFPDGRTAAIPVDWTDRRPASPPIKVRGQTPRLHPEALLQLCEYLAACRLVSPPEQPIDAATNGIIVGADGAQGPELRRAVGSDSAGAPRRIRKPASQSTRRGSSRA